MDDYLCMFLIILSITVTFLVTLSLTSMDSVSRSKVKKGMEENEGKYKRLYKMLEKPSRYRFTDNLIRSVMFAMGIFSVIALSISDFKLKVIAAVLYIALYTGIGEILPFKIAKQAPEKNAIRLTGIQRSMQILFLPVTLITEAIANVILRIFKKKTDVDSNEFSEEDIMSLLEAGEKSGDLKRQSKNLIGSIFRFDDEFADEIMTPRTDVFMIDINDPQEEYIDELMSLKYSRIPVYEGEYDNIIGVLNVKDYLIKAREAGFDNVDIKPILREPYFVPETKNIDSLFREMQRDKQHIAILIDEYGGFSGIATMEDIIEEIVGDIDDEYDEEDDEIDKIAENTFLVDGSVALDDLNEATGSKLESETSETIGGFLIDLLGEIPDDGYLNMKLEYENYFFTILQVRERRIERVKMVIREKQKTM